MKGILDNPEAGYAKLKELGKGLFGPNGGGLGAALGGPNGGGLGAALGGLLGGQPGAPGQPGQPAGRGGPTGKYRRNAGRAAWRQQGQGQPAPVSKVRGEPGDGRTIRWAVNLARPSAI